ncbi:hypothetical protein HQ531_02370 [bacterium]|nr:hypothetical protein [bacterium]
MKYIIMSIACVAFLIGCGGEKKAEPMEHDPDAHAKMEKPQMQAMDEKLIYYTCPMESHKHIHSKEAGSCSECGMTLVPAVVTSEDKMEYYGCPMEIHSHVRQETPGKCDECGMDLKPMRLEKSA